MKSIIEKLKSLSGGTILRTILQLLVYINQIVAFFGNASLFGYADSLWYQIFTLVITIAVTVFTYWYNNDWSKFAQLAGSIFDMLKDGKITKEEIDEFVKQHKDVKVTEEEKHE